MPIEYTEIELLQIKIKALESQIQKMRNCRNCKHEDNYNDLPGRCHNCTTNNQIGWELDQTKRVE